MLYEDIQNKTSVIEAIGEFNQLGEKLFLEKYGFGSSVKYDLIFEGNRYPPKAIIAVAYKYEFDRDPLAPDQCKNSKILRQKYKMLGFEVREKGNWKIDSARTEIQFRRNLWQQLHDAGGPKNIPASLVNELKVYYGGRGVWIDKARTSFIVGEGVTVGLLHTGEHYVDSLAEDGVLYHYPNTKNKGHDSSDIAATKKAHELGIPLFVVTTSEGNPSNRDVYLGWVEDWDDKGKFFMISFIEFPEDDKPIFVEELVSIDEIPFNLTEKRPDKFTKGKSREGQAHFRFEVLKRYGSQCAVCDIALKEMLIAAHLHPHKKGGTNDPRNGLPLCANHHLAFDQNLFGIDPENFGVEYKSGGPGKEELGIEVDDLMHLKILPESKALEFNWKKFNSQKH